MSGPLKPSLVEWKPHQGHSPLWAFSSLETFLGGMETPSVIEGQVITLALETFLGGMETAPKRQMAGGAERLETFLGGMETAAPYAVPGTVRGSLKPSLVEWKQNGSSGFTWRPMTLKPSLVEWKLLQTIQEWHRHTILETFLGGMETGVEQVAQLLDVHLETFLGGMETNRRSRCIPSRRPLKPSLVEWKRLPHARPPSLVLP